MCHLL